MFPSPYTPRDADAWIRLNAERDPKADFAIVADGQLAGGIGFHRLSDVHRIGAEIGYWLGERFWGRGIATAACRKLTDFAFEQHGFRRIEAAVFAPNVASCRVLEKCGYVCEGVMKNAVIKRGNIWDAHLYAATR